MEHVNLGAVIEQAISKFGQNRIGDKPPVLLLISPTTTSIPWHDRSLKEFVRMFLYETLLTNDPDAIIEITLRRKITLKDLNAFVGVRPACWVQLRVAGRGLKVRECLIEELCAEIGYHCEEWVGVQDSAALLGIFGNKHKPELKIIFCMELSRNILKCDLLLPVFETVPLTSLAVDEAKHAAPRT
jgi:DNA-binding Xre family transcriptional regulator